MWLISDFVAHYSNMSSQYEIGIKMYKIQKKWEFEVLVPVQFGRYQRFPSSWCLLSLIQNVEAAGCCKMFYASLLTYIPSVEILHNENHKLT